MFALGGLIKVPFRSESGKTQDHFDLTYAVRMKSYMSNKFNIFKQNI